jgi:hypothetical protein
MSFIYRHLRIYRIIMNLLYFGKYKKRFNDVIALFEKQDRTIVELCFGDIYIASHCRKTGKTWTGYDMNRSFVANAIGKGYCAYCGDVAALESLPPADVCVIVGSLYHFHDAMDKLLFLSLGSAPKIIISEPVRNLASRPGLIGKIAAVLSNAGKGQEQFRYNRESLLQMLDNFKKKYKFNYDILSAGKDIVLKVTHERNQHRHSDL